MLLFNGDFKNTLTGELYDGRSAKVVQLKYHCFQIMSLEKNNIKLRHIIALNDFSDKHQFKSSLKVLILTY